MSSKSKWGWLLLSGASVAAFGAINPAAAQDAGVSDEIVVTATGRAAAIQDVPLAVTALSGEALEEAGVDNLADVEQLAPGFRVYAGQSNSAGTIARIRGIGTGGDNPGFESAVGVFIDGVYRARSGVAMSDLPELERIEVLRGPQGTLFGRNTSAGAINIVTAGPEFDGVHFWGSGTSGNLGMGAFTIGMNAPASDTLAFRIDGSARERDGYINDLISGDKINNVNRWGVRGQALWDINEDATLRVVIDASETNEVCCAVTPIVYGAPQIIVEGIVGPTATVPGEVAADGAPSINAGRALFGGNLVSNLEDRNMTVTPGRDYSEAINEQGYSAQLDWDIGDGLELTSITAGRHWAAERNQDIDFSLFDLAYRDGLELGFETFSQEFRLHGEAGKLDWLVGAFMGSEKLDTTDRIRLGVHANFYINGLTQLLTTSSLGAPYEVFDSSGPPGPVDDDRPFPCLGSPVPGAGAQDPVPSLFYAAGVGAGACQFENIYLANSNPGGTGQVADHWQVQTDTLALFTHNEFSFTESLILTVGVRYNQDEKSLTANLNAMNPTCLNLQGIEATTAPLVPGPGGIVTAMLPSAAGAVLSLACNPAVNPVANGDWSGDREENEWSGTTSLAFHVNEDIMIYGGYSRGYKSGGFNVDRSAFSITPALLNSSTLSTSQLEFEPEFTDAYELGVKTTLFGGATLFNANLFYEQIHGYQNNSFNGTNFITRNVPETISQGAEIDFFTRLTPNLSFQGGLLYNDAFYDSTVNYLAPNPDADGDDTIFAGDKLDHASEWTTTGAVTYEMPIGASHKATFYLDGRWNSEYRNQTLSRDPEGRTDQDAFAIFNGRVSFANLDDTWSLELWGRNLLDEFYTVGAFEATFQPGTYLIYPGEPRTYGVTLRARY